MEALGCGFECLRDDLADVLEDEAGCEVACVSSAHAI